jgi:hypothetical protein
MGCPGRPSPSGPGCRWSPISVTWGGGPPAPRLGLAEPPRVVDDDVSGPAQGAVGVGGGKGNHPGPLHQGPGSLRAPLMDLPPGRAVPELAVHVPRVRGGEAGGLCLGQEVVVNAQGVPRVDPPPWAGEPQDGPPPLFLQAGGRPLGQECEGAVGRGAQEDLPPSPAGAGGQFNRRLRFPGTRGPPDQREGGVCCHVDGSRPPPPLWPEGGCLREPVHRVRGAWTGLVPEPPQPPMGALGPRGGRDNDHTPRCRVPDLLPPGPHCHEPPPRVPRRQPPVEIPEGGPGVSGDLPGVDGHARRPCRDDRALIRR